MTLVLIFYLLILIKVILFLWKMVNKFWLSECLLLYKLSLFNIKSIDFGRNFSCVFFFKCDMQVTKIIMIAYRSPYAVPMAFIWSVLIECVDWFRIGKFSTVPSPVFLPQLLFLLALCLMILIWWEKGTLLRLVNCPLMFFTKSINDYFHLKSFEYKLFAISLLVFLYFLFLLLFCCVF